MSYEPEYACVPERPNPATCTHRRRVSPTMGTVCARCGMRLDEGTGTDASVGEARTAVNR
jgi:hypothetical protein